MGLQRVVHDLVTEQQWTPALFPTKPVDIFLSAKAQPSHN